MTTANEEGTPGLSNTEHLGYAAERDWTVLTFDDGSLSLVDSGAFGDEDAE